MVANDGVEKQCVEIMKKEGIIRNQAFLKRELTEEIRGTWTDEMVSQYETLVVEKVDNMVRESFKEGVVECMEDEVAKDNLGSTEFRTKDEILNVGMSGCLKQNEVRNLISRNNINMLEDFPTAFANFLPFGPSDHSPDILVLLDVMGRKKKSFRFSNYLANKEGLLDKRVRNLDRENGNVCEKSKMLKEELCRVQYALSKDPSNTNLREEELLYADAYKKAMLDE
nr:hypothetical protein [Tanacetum cinerariifolium]